jgi:hypothetical protein
MTTELDFTHKQVRERLDGDEDNMGLTDVCLQSITYHVFSTHRRWCWVCGLEIPGLIFVDMLKGGLRSDEDGEITYVEVWS